MEGVIAGGDHEGRRVRNLEEIWGYRWGNNVMRLERIGLGVGEGKGKGTGK